jgi:hypothetical protein
MIKAGIVDATNVVRHALQDAASLAGLLVTTEAIVANKPEPKPACRQCRRAVAWAGWTFRPHPPLRQRTPVHGRP